MSFQAMTWAVNQKCANAGQKLVLLMLANCCNGHTGQCNPSHKRLAEECCMGVSTLKSHLSALEESGLIEVIHKAIDGVSLPNQYMLKLEGVGQNLADGGSDSDRGVGQNLATNQELKPGIEPVRVMPAPAAPDGFLEFWKEWPSNSRKGGRSECLKLWIKNKLEPISQDIIAHVNASKQTKQWKDDGGQYIPAPAVYLRGRRWDGAEIEESRPKSWRDDPRFKGAVNARN